MKDFIALRLCNIWGTCSVSLVSGLKEIKKNIHKNEQILYNNILFRKTSTFDWCGCNIFFIRKCTRKVRTVSCLWRLCQRLRSVPAPVGEGGLQRTASPRDLGISQPGAWITWQRRPATHVRLWSGLSGSGSPRYWPTCTSSRWRTRTGGRDGIRSPPCSSSSSGTIHSAAASRCSPVWMTACCSCAAFASQTKVSMWARTLLFELFKLITRCS